MTLFPFASIRIAMNSILRALFGLAMTLIIVSCSLLPFGPTASPSGTNTPGPSPTPPAPPAATATETPVPIVRVGSGDKALFDGDVDTAMLQYRAASLQTDDPNIRSAALWGLARAQVADERYTDAIVTLDVLITGYPNSPYAAPAHFLQGQSDLALEHYADAANAYQAYLSGRPGVLD